MAEQFLGGAFGGLELGTTGGRGIFYDFMVDLEFESGMNLIYQYQFIHRNLQWIMLAWSCLTCILSLSYTGQHEQLSILSCFSSVLVRQLPFFVLHTPPTHPFRWTSARISNVHAKTSNMPNDANSYSPAATYENLTQSRQERYYTSPTPSALPSLNMREHLHGTCKHLQHVNTRNMPNAGNKGTQQFKEAFHARGRWPQ